MIRAQLSPISKVLIVDFGGQYTHLIARRVRELGAFSEILPFDRIWDIEINRETPVILSGSHMSLLTEGNRAREVMEFLVSRGVRHVLGICFGHQLLSYYFGGEVSFGCSEYGGTRVRITGEDPLFSGWEKEEIAWMSHGDCVVKPPPNSDVIAISENGYIAAIRISSANGTYYGVQFHPEVHHTTKGPELLGNFLSIAGVERAWGPGEYLNQAKRIIAESIPEGERAVAAVSGGIDSTVAAFVAKAVLGDRLVPILIDHGLFREGEVEEVVAMLEPIGLKPVVVDARERFLGGLEGKEDCEERRVIIGEEYARVLAEFAESVGARHIIQGTTYPDVIESGPGAADKIKSHHNVGGLPKWVGERFSIVEPLRYLYKDEVRALAKLLGLPNYFIERHPFPGPGLAVRIIGEFTRRKLEICRKASKVVEDVLRERGILGKAWQAFAVVGDDKWVGVKGDARANGYVVIIRVVESSDGMTADYMKIPYDVLDEAARRIYNAIPEVTMVAYAITPKPPSTIEPC